MESMWGTTPASSAASPAWGDQTYAHSGPMSSYGTLEDSDFFQIIEDPASLNFPAHGSIEDAKTDDIPPLPTAEYKPIGDVRRDDQPTSYDSVVPTIPAAAEPAASPSAFPLSLPSASSPAARTLRVRVGTSNLPPYMYLQWTRPMAYPESPLHSSSTFKPKKTSEPAPSSKVVPAPITFAEVREELDPEELADEKPTRLFKYLRPRKVDGETKPPLIVPDPAQLVEILTALDKHASKKYMMEAANDERYTDVMFKWITQARRDPKKWAKTLPMLFKVLSKTDIPMNYIQEKKIGTTVAEFGKELATMNLPNSAAIQDGILAFRKWVSKTLVPKGRTVKPDVAGKDKRPASDSKDQPTAKRQKSEEPAARSSTRPDASSFGKGSNVVNGRTLPSFQKKTGQAVPPPAPAPAPAPAGSSSSLLASTLARLRENAGPSKAGSGISDPTSSAFNPRPIPVKAVKVPNKKGFNIRFRDDEGKGELEMVRLFKEEPHEFERPFWMPETDEDSAVSHMKEGAFMNVHKDLEEEVDWSEPEAYETGVQLIAPTPEALVQEKRELGVLNVQYANGTIPPSPDETGVKTVQKGPRTGTWLPLQHSSTRTDVSTLLGALNPTLFAQQPQPAYGYGNTYAPQPSAYTNTPYAPPQPQGYYPPPVATGYGNWGTDNGWNAAPRQTPSGYHNGYQNAYASQY